MVVHTGNARRVTRIFNAGLQKRERDECFQRKKKNHTDFLDEILHSNSPVLNTYTRWNYNKVN